MSSSDSSTDSDSSNEELILEALLQPVDDDELEILMRECESSSSSESESSVEEPPTKMRRHNSSYVETINAYTDEEFKHHFRISRDTYKFVVALVATTRYFSYRPSGRENVPITTALLMMLCYLSNKDTFRQLSDHFEVTVSCAHTTISRCINSLVLLSSEYIRWPSEAEAVTIEKGFYDKQGIHGILGALGGRYVREDSNKKHCRYIPVQAVTDHRGKFLDAFCGEAGTPHDTQLLIKSPLYEKIHNKKLYLGEADELFLVGDSTYPSLPWLVTPFRDTGNLTGKQENFNYKHSATGTVIQDAFSLLMGRFRSLQSFKSKSVLFVADCVIAACVLHNICVERDDFINVEDVEIEENNEYPCDEQDVNDARRIELFLEMYPS